jgi:hypothetical protein
MAWLAVGGIAAISTGVKFPSRLPGDDAVGLPVVGRRRPGDPMRFAVVTVEEAEALCRAEERRLAELVAALEPVPSCNGVDLASLYGGNLISGVVSGVE